MTGAVGSLIIVGVDGSPAAERAAFWAAAEAQLRGAALRLLHAYSVPFVFYGSGTSPESVDRAVRHSAAALLGRCSAAIRQAYPGLDVTTEVHAGSPVDALRAASAHAALTVVGSHGSHQLTEAVLGSVAARICGHAHGPVVVIRTDPAAPSGGPPGAGDGPVVVGLDGSPESDQALAFGLRSAAVRGSSLIAIRTWDDTALDGFPDSQPILLDPDLADQQEQQFLAEQVRPWSEKYPEIPVRQLVLRGRPAAALLDYCNSTDPKTRPSLLVVGSRGRGGFAGALLGSTSHALIARSTCGVAIVRSDPAN